MSKRILPFIDNQKLIEHIQYVYDAYINAFNDADQNFYKNSIDPFSAIFKASFQQCSLEKWKEQEKIRQLDKTFQNKIGDFHQRILGSIDGWSDLKTGNLLDIVSNDKKIIAEIKNKHNTTKGNHKKNVYDDILFAISNDYKGYTGYYVEIIPPNKKVYNKPFTPSDNETKTRRSENNSIRVIDGKSFYDLATGFNNSLKMLYDAIPEVVSSLSNSEQSFDLTKDPVFNNIFYSTYNK
jgi:hypothetical protein